MPSPFREVLSVPGALAFSAAGMIARFPISMLSIGIIVMLSYTNDSYGLAGVVAAVAMIARAIWSPPLARWVDRFGQRRVMVPTVITHCLAVPGLIVVAVTGLPVWTLFVLAIIAGASVGSVGSLVRARWVQVTRTQAMLRTAFSWEAIVDELVFMIGPIFVTMLGAQIHPAAGLVAALVAVAIGSLIFYGQTRTEPEPQPHESGDRAAVLANATIAIVVVMFVFLGAGMGAVDVVVVAYTRDHGMPAMGGVLLAIVALGSLIAGFVYGSVRWTSSDGLRLICSVGLLGTISIGLPMAGNVFVLAAVLFLTGMMIAPTIIAGNAVIQAVSLPSQLTEALTWVSTALSIGISLGSGLAGPAVDRFEAESAFGVVTAFCLIAALAALAGWTKLTKQPAPHES